MSKTYEQLEPVISALDERIKTNSSAFPTDTASGVIASFSDGADAPVKSLVVDIEPVQDLHGYDSPYPAGGGKNKFDVADESIVNTGVTFTASNNTLTCIGIAESGYPNKIFNLTEEIPAGTHTVSFVRNDGGKTTATIRIRYKDGTNYGIGSAQSVKLTHESPITSFQLATSAGNEYATTLSNIQIEEGSTATAFAPYSNICPISGFDSVKVTRTGKNLLNYSAFQQYAYWSDSIVTYGAYPTTGGDKGYLLPVVSGLTYTVSLGISSSSFPTYCYICRANGSDTSERVQAFTTRSFGVASITFTAESGWIYYVRIGNLTIESTFAAQMEKVSNAQLELGSTATAYEPYQGETYDITFPSEAGTVYGGTLDVTNGVLTVDMDIMDMGTLNWTYNSAKQRIVAQVNSAKPAGANVGLDGACSVYKVVNTGYQSAPDKSIIIGNNFVSNSYAAMVVRDEDYTDAETFKTAVSGQTLVFPIKNPVVYQLTPTEVKSLLGQNNVWADTGDTTVEYRADTSAYIAKKIAEAISALS